MAGLSVTPGQSASAQEVTPEAGTLPGATIPPARTTYLGRSIAQTMHFTGASWLVRGEREREESCQEMVGQLGLRPGMTVCDMGCGNGFYALEMARLVGDAGRVLAVDIQPEMLRMLQARAAETEITNITSILGAPHDPHLPVGEVDLILLVDVYHEFSHPESMLAHMWRSLKPNGRIVLLEYREEDRLVPIKPLHKMSKKQIIREMAPNGFVLDQQYDRLPWQHMMFFRRGGFLGGSSSADPVRTTAL